MLAGMEAESFSACVCDPPYHLTADKKGGTGIASLNVNSPAGRSRISTGFMGKAWDGGDVAFRPETWAAVLRVLKPGAYLAAFASARRYHRMVCAIEDAGFIIHPMLGFITGQGFPKATSVSKAIDKAAGAEREIIGTKPRFPDGGRGARPGQKAAFGGGIMIEHGAEVPVTAPATEAAKQWDGWYYGLQSLKPALEPICLAQKPFAEVTSDEIHALTGWDHWCSSRSDGEDKIITARSLRPGVRSYRARFDKEGREVAREDSGEYAPFVLDNGTANCIKHGTGALNIDASRIPVSSSDPQSYGVNGDEGSPTLGVYGDRKRVGYERAPEGRWPAQICHDGSPEVMEAFARFGEKTSGYAELGPTNGQDRYFTGKRHQISSCFADTGTAARFFYTAKAAAWERCDSNHPCVKPQALMEWLVKLITPPNSGPLLDPFCGTGSTLVACDWLGIDAVGIDDDPQTCRDAEVKIKRLRARRMLGDVAKVEPIPGQLRLF